MYLTTKALVLRVREYDERHSIIKLLTQEQGLIIAKVRNLRRKNNPLSAPCQLLVYGEFTLFQYGDRYTLNEAHCLNMFQNLRRDIECFALGTYFAQVAEFIVQESQEDQGMLQLVLNCLYALSELKLPQAQVKAVFELRTACIAGFMPDLSGCVSCGNPRADRFDIFNGQLSCSECATHETRSLRMPVSGGILDAMRYITVCPASKIFSFRLGEESLQGLGKITESFLITQLEHGFSSLDFYKSLFASYI